MADAPVSPRRPESAQTASHLQYPTLPPLSVSVEHWLSHSRPTNNMTSDRLSDAPSKSLSDSWATLSVSDLHSEDGSRSEQTDTGSLIDQTTSDDVASLDERYSSSDTGEPDEEDHQEEEDEGGEQGEEQSTLGSQHFPPLYTPVGSSIDDSGLTARPVFRQSSESIEFVEPEKWPEMERVELKHTIRIFDDPVASEMKSRLPASTADSILMATVQQTMTKQSLDLNKPFRVLYVGQPEYRNIILDKIGDVLVSSSSSGSQTSSAESSRYHVVPTSYGVGAVPNFAELLPIHVQLVVDECMEATTEPGQDQPNTLHLSFKNRPACRSWWDGARYRVASASEWTLPDVAILFVSGRDDAAAVQTQRLAHTFLERHGIPAMMISEEPLWELASDILPLNHDSLHMCLESRHPQTGETTVLQRYPIDLKTFESITPSQLNRNLASLMELYPNKGHKPSASTLKAEEQYSPPDLEKSPLGWIPSHYTAHVRELAPMLRLVALTLISGIVLSMGFVAVKAVVLCLVQWMTGSSLSCAFSPATTSIPTTAIALGNVEQAALSIRPPGNIGLIRTPPPDYLMDQVTDLENSASSTSVGPDDFDIQVVGDCHVMVKPPRHLTTSGKQPRFNVSVRRFDRALPFELSRLFVDVYALRLDREEAWGVLNVTVTAKSTRGVNQTTTVDFGTPWLKIANWRRAARLVSSQLTKDLQVAHTGLTEVYGRLSTDLQVIMGDVVKRSHFLRHDAERLRQEGRLARDTVLSRSKQLSQFFTRNAVQQFRGVSSVLHHRSLWVNNQAHEFVKDAWNRLGQSAGRMDLCSMMDRARSARCAPLDRAQSRARQFMGKRAASSDCSESHRSKC